MSETQDAPQLSGSMFLFERPELMTKEAHGEIGLTMPSRRFGFCSKVRAIPLTVSEIPAAMKDYPIVLMSMEQVVPLAVVGLTTDVNLFVDDNGNWEENRYVPGYIRRYPFGLASESSGERMAVVIDAAFDGFKKDGETPLFVDGAPSESTQAAIEFCKTFERDRALTNEFARQLKELGILAPQTAQYTPQGATDARPFAQYVGIDETKFKALTDDQILALNKSGLLAIIYAMMMSLPNWRTLLQRRAKRYGLSEDQLLNEAVGQ